MLFFLAILGVVVALVSWSQARRIGSPSAPLALLVAFGLALAGLSQAVVVVPAGHVGVVDVFGRVSPQTLKSGLNLVNPLARVIKMSIKTQDLKEVMDVPSQEGLTVKLEVSDDHMSNFFQAVKSRKDPISPVEAGHKSAVVGHLIVIALRTGRSLKWDPAKEVFVGDGASEANKHLARAMRKPYDTASPRKRSRPWRTRCVPATDC